MSKKLNITLSLILVILIIVFNFLPALVPNLSIKQILLLIAILLATSLLDSSSIFKKIELHLAKLVDQKNFSSKELTDALDLGFEYCKNSVGEFRIYAISSTKILSYIEPIKNIHIKKCKLMVRKFGDCMSSTDQEFEREIKTNINRWCRLEQIENIEVVCYNNYPLDYCCIFDDKFLLLGQYSVDDNDISNVSVETPLSITKNTDAGRQMISNYTKRFDNYFKSSDYIRNPCLRKSMLHNQHVETNKTES